MKTCKLKSGFTLIETLVYLSLYAVIMSGAIVAIYSIFESSARNQAQAMVQEEGSYLIGKIDWAMSNAVSIQQPTNTGSVLSITRFDHSAVTISQNGANLEFSENGAPAVSLNNTNIGVTGLLFTHTNASSDGIDPESIQAEITISATTSDGHVFSRSFTTIKFLRK